MPRRALTYKNLLILFFMGNKIALTLKTGPLPNEEEHDTRTLYNGRVNLVIGTTFKDDYWTRKPNNGNQEPIFFALHVSPAHIEDVIDEIDTFKRDCREKTAKESVIDFLNRLRRNYIHRMPQIAEGNLVYAFLDETKRLHFRYNEEVTHKERRE